MKENKGKQKDLIVRYLKFLRFPLYHIPVCITPKGKFLYFACLHFLLDYSEFTFLPVYSKNRASQFAGSPGRIHNRVLADKGPCNS